MRLGPKSCTKMKNHMYLFNNQTKRDNQTKVQIWGDPQALKTCPRGHPQE